MGLNDLPYIGDLKGANGDGFYSWCGIPIEIKGDKIRLTIAPENIKIDPSIAGFESKYKPVVRKLLQRLETEKSSEKLLRDLYINAYEMAHHSYLVKASCEMLSYEFKDKEWEGLLRRSIPILKSNGIDTDDISKYLSQDLLNKLLGSEDF